MTMADNQQNAVAAKNGINRPVFDILRVTAAAMVFMIHFAGYRNLPKPQFVFMFFRHFNFGVCKQECKGIFCKTCFENYSGLLCDYYFCHYCMGYHTWTDAKGYDVRNRMAKILPVFEWNHTFGRVLLLE